jgi:hypothetical protein
LSDLFLSYVFPALWVDKTLINSKNMSHSNSKKKNKRLRYRFHRSYISFFIVPDGMNLLLHKNEVKSKK